MRRSHREPRRSNRRGRVALIGVAAVVAEAAALWLRTRHLAGEVTVRCRAGHVFRTLWIPGASVKSLRLLAWRFQYCPVGRHWALVTPVDERDLDDEERRMARAHHDVRIP